MKEEAPIRNGHFIVLYRYDCDKDGLGDYHVSRRRFETESDATFYALGVHPSRKPCVLKVVWEVPDYDASER